MVTHRMIEAFKTVVQSGSVTRAAGVMNISQPSVSRLLSDLEARLGLRLFERRGTRLTVTAAALELLEEVERSFIGLERVRHAAAQIRTRQSGGLTVAAISALGYSLLPSVLRAFREAGAPPLKLHIVPSQAALTMLALRQCDLAFATIPPSAEIGRRIAEFALRARVILPAHHRLAGESGPLGPEDLAREPMVALVAHSLPRVDIDRAFAGQGVRPPVVVETMQAYSAAQMVREGLGFALVDPMTAAVHVAAGGWSRPFLPAVDLSFGAYTWRPAEDAGGIEQLVSLVTAAVRDIPNG